MNIATGTAKGRGGNRGTGRVPFNHRPSSARLLGKRICWAGVGFERRVANLDPELRPQCDPQVAPASSIFPEPTAETTETSAETSTEADKPPA